jgi:hypothetical protein
LEQDLGWELEQDWVLELELGLEQELGLIFDLAPAQETGGATVQGLTNGTTEEKALGRAFVGRTWRFTGTSCNWEMIHLVGRCNDCSKLTGIG